MTTPTPKTREIDYLDEDVIKVPGQVFALVSCVGPDAAQKSDKVAIKIRGVFATRDEAARHVKNLMAADDAFHIYLVEVGKWLQMPPPTEDIDDQEYSEEFMQNLMKGYRDNQREAKIHHAQRKKAIMEQGLDANLTDEERLPPPPGAAPTNALFETDNPHPSTSAEPVVTD